MLTVAPVGIKMSRKYLRVFAYLFDKNDGTIYLEPVSTWRVKFKTSARGGVNHSILYLDKISRSMASGAGTPYDYRDSYVIFADTESLPLGDEIMV
jgi:hypothetical protein